MLKLNVVTEIKWYQETACSVKRQNMNAGKKLLGHLRKSIVYDKINRGSFSAHVNSGHQIALGCLHCISGYVVGSHAAEK